MKAETALLAATAGPTVIDVLGYEMPLLSVLTAVAGVVLAYCLAPKSAREPSLGGSIVLLLLFTLLLIAAEIYFRHTPLVALGWAIGLGYSGRIVLAEISTPFIDRLRAVIAALFKTTEDPK